MRTLVLVTWVFINLVFFGMCAYMYLLWSQYWMSDGKDVQSTTLNYDREIYYYNHGFPSPYFNDTKQNTNLTEKKNRIKHSVKESSPVIKNSQPRFPSLHTNFQMNTLKYTCLNSDNVSVCGEKTLLFKKMLLKELNRVLLDESNVLKAKNKNGYNVTFTGTRRNYIDIAPRDILNNFLKLKIKTLKKADFETSDDNFKNYLPKKQLFENRYFKSCAVVASSGALRNSKLGRLIDSHNVVLRFNDAPTKGFEADVGQKTTMRVVNSQVITEKKFNFLHSKLFENVTLVAWDPANYTSSLEEWYRYPEHNFIPNYKEYKRKFPKSRFFIVNPSSLWDLWTFLQSLMPHRLRRNPPSSGFLGISILLPRCDYVDVFEYVPSVRASQMCHYYDNIEDSACTFGVWHPLAAEKLLAYHLNIENDTIVFQRGVIRIPGYQTP